MAINKSKLLDFLNRQVLLMEEKRMWLAVGFYIYPHSTTTDRHGYPATLLIDHMGNEEKVTNTVAANLRISIMSWWETESITPRVKERKKTEVTSSDTLDELETSRG